MSETTLTRTETLCTSCGQVTALGSSCDYCDTGNPDAAERTCPDCEGVGRLWRVRAARSSDMHPGDLILGGCECEECGGTGRTSTPFLEESVEFRLAYESTLKALRERSRQPRVQLKGMLADAARLGQRYGRSRWHAARDEGRRTMSDEPWVWAPLDPWTCPLEEIPLRPPYKELREVEPAWWQTGRVAAQAFPALYIPCPICGFEGAVRMYGVNTAAFIYCGFCARTSGRIMAKLFRDWTGLELVPAGLGGGA